MTGLIKLLAFIVIFNSINSSYNIALTPNKIIFTVL